MVYSISFVCYLDDFCCLWEAWGSLGFLFCGEVGVFVCPPMNVYLNTNVISPKIWQPMVLFSLSFGKLMIRELLVSYSNLTSFHNVMWFICFSLYMQNIL